MWYIWLGEDGGVEALNLNFSHQNTIITTNCWTIINKIEWKLTKKISYTQRQRRSYIKMVGGVLSWYKQSHPYPLGGWPTCWKITISQRLSHRCENSKRHVRFQSFRIWQWEEGPQSIWHWRTVGLVHRSSKGLRKTEAPLLEGAHGFLVHWVTGKSRTP